MSMEHASESTAFYQKYPIADRDNSIEGHKNDPVTKATLVLAGLAIAATGALLNDTVREWTSRATAKEVELCASDTLRGTRDPQPGQTEVSVQLTGDTQCVTIKVPYVTSIETTTTLLDGSTQSVQSILPEYLRLSGYISQETLAMLSTIAPHNEPVWFDTEHNTDGQ